MSSTTLSLKVFRTDPDAPTILAELSGLSDYDFGVEVGGLMLFSDIGRNAIVIDPVTGVRTTLEINPISTYSSNKFRYSEISGGVWAFRDALMCHFSRTEDTITPACTTKAELGIRGELVLSQSTPDGDLEAISAVASVNDVERIKLSYDHATQKVTVSSRIVLQSYDPNSRTLIPIR